MPEPATPIPVTDVELALIFCGRDRRRGTFSAPAGVLTKEPGRMLLRRAPAYVAPPDVVSACPSFAASFHILKPGDEMRMRNPGTRLLTAEPAGPSAAVILQTILIDPQVPCEIPGCEGWRKELTQAWAALSSTCSSCERNTVLTRVMQKYTPVVEAFLRANPDFRLKSE